MARPYRYCIKKDSTTYYTISAGSVTTTNTPTYYYNGVDNFKNIGIEDRRNMRMHGFFRNGQEDKYVFTDKLYKILKYIFLTEGVMGKAILYIERFNKKNQVYEYDYQSNINFRNCNYDHVRLSADLMQSDIQELLKSRENVVYPIPVEGNGKMITTRIRPQRVLGKAVFVTADDEEYYNGANKEIGNTPSMHWPNILFFEDNYLEIKEALENKPLGYAAPRNPSYMIGQQPYLVVGTYPAYNFLGVGYLFKANTDLYNVKIKFTLPVFIDNKDASNDVNLWLRIYSADTQYFSLGGNATSLVETSAAINVLASSTVNSSFTIDANFDLQEGNYIHIVVEKSNTNVVEYNWAKDVLITVDYEYYTSEFQISGLNTFDTGQYLVGLLTDNKAEFKSDLLTKDISYAEGINCKPNRIMNLSTESIRQLPLSKIKLSFSDFFQFLNSFFTCCVAIEKETINGVEKNYIRIEKLSYMYQMRKANNDLNIIAVLGEPSKFPRVMYASDLDFNELHIGSPEHKHEDGDPNGRYEYNTTMKLLTSNTKEGNVLDWTSPVSASWFEIYRTWIKGVTDETKDVGSSNDNFVLQYGMTPNHISGIYEALYPEEIKPTYQSGDVTGVIDPANAINLGLTPKCSFIRGSYYFLSLMYQANPDSFTYLFKFLTLDKNTELVTNLTGSYQITESSSEYVDVIAARYGLSRLFYPYYIESSHQSPKAYRQAWEDNRAGVFQHQIDGVIAYSFPIISRERNGVPKVQSFKLLLSALNQPTDFT